MTERFVDRTERDNDRDYGYQPQQRDIDDDRIASGGYQPPSSDTTENPPPKKP